MEVNYLIFWGTFGLCAELCFTAIRDLITNRQINLIGHTSLWMIPVYALGLSHGFDFIVWFVDNEVVRYLTYPLWIWGVELIIGIPTSKRGIRLWNYDYLPKILHWRGIVSFAHYPLWVGFGILIELIK